MGDLLSTDCVLGGGSLGVRGVCAGGGGVR